MSDTKLLTMAKTSDPQIFAESIFPKAFGTAAQDSYIELEEKERLNTEYKHRMKLNRNISIGILKNELVKALLETDPEVQAQRFQAIYDELARNVVPIRDGRHYKRTKGLLAAKFSNTHKLSF